MDQAEVIVKIEEVFGREKGQKWLNRPNVILDGKTPAEYIQTEEGMKEVMRILAAIKYGGVA